jgi:hypothetical protein
MFMAVADKGDAVATSLNGRDFVSVSPIPFTNVSRTTPKIVHTGTHFCVVCLYSDEIALSDDGGLSWTVKVMPRSMALMSSICYGAGKILVHSGGYQNVMFSNDNGDTWQLSANLETYNISGSLSAYGNGMFVISHGNSPVDFYVSSDCDVWSVRSRVSAYSTSDQELLFTGAEFVFHDKSLDKFVHSSDTLTWTLTDGVSSYISSSPVAAYGNGVVCVTDPGIGSTVHATTASGYADVAISLIESNDPDGLQWADWYDEGSWSSMDYGAGVFCLVASGVGSTIVLTSPDGTFQPYELSVPPSFWTSFNGQTETV